MKNLILVACLAFLGYWSYKEFFTSRRPAAAAVAAGSPTPSPTPVDFAVRFSVRSLYAEWKRRELSRHSPQGAVTIDMASKLADVRRRLYAQGLHSEEALTRSIGSALRELGVPPGEAQYVVKSILKEAEPESEEEAAVGAANLPVIPQILTPGRKEKQ